MQVQTNQRGITTRRSLLWQGSCAILAAMFPPGSSFTAEPVGPVMAKLSAYMSAARDKSLPEDVAEKAKQHILDTVSAMISGSGLVPGQAAIEFVRAYGGGRLSTIVGSNVLGGPIEAALANWVLAHSDETDDSHAPSQSHPGCAVIPAAWASGIFAWQRNTEHVEKAFVFAGMPPRSGTPPLLC